GRGVCRCLRRFPDGGDDGGSADAADGETAEAPADAPPGDATATDDPAPQPGTVRPDWLGTRVLPTNADGVVPPQETPPEMVNRRYPTVDLFPTPTDNEFRATAEPVTDEVLARSTWNETCPVTPDELLYLRMSFWGFDDRPHLGEMIVHREVADDVVGVFRTLFDARFPIEEMRVTEASELDAPPTGDGNNTTSFVCRAAVGSARFSEHAFGLAVDINPFQNPYQKGDLVLPELSTSYLDRSDVRPGMILEGDVVVGAFDAIGWGWGGRWRTLDDYHHFSRNNR
ncbi:MAG: M15 family metallopeptidase, partial [Actinomycetota bacterium]